MNGCFLCVRMDKFTRYDKSILSPCENLLTLKHGLFHASSDFSQRSGDIYSL